MPNQEKPRTLDVNDIKIKLFSTKGKEINYSGLSPELKFSLVVKQVEGLPTEDQFELFEGLKHILRQKFGRNPCDPDKSQSGIQMS